MNAVGYIVTHHPRVALTFIRNEMRAVEANGFAVHPFAMNVPTDADMKAPDAEFEKSRTIYLKPRLAHGAIALALLMLRHPIIFARVFWMTIASSGWSVMRFARRMSHLLQACVVEKNASRLGISHLHAHFGLAPATIAWLAAEIARGKGRPSSFSFTIHGYHDFVDQQESRLDLKAGAAAFVVCISDYTRAQLCQLTDPALWSKYKVVRCGIDLSQFSFSPRAKRGEGTKILSVGRLSPEKGFGILIAAVAQLAAQGRDVRLRLIGDGPSRGALIALAEQLNVSDRVNLSGEANSDAVKEALEAADIFCLPSFNEGLPVSIMEAMAVGTPVVTTHIAGIPELARNKETAFTVAPGNVDALAGALDAAIVDPKALRDMVFAARAAVEQDHDQRKSGQELAGLFANPPSVRSEAP